MLKPGSTQSRRAVEDTIHPPETFEVGEKVIVPTYVDDRYHNATVIEYPVYFNEKQRQKYVRVLVTDSGREENVLRREALKVNQE